MDHPKDQPLSLVDWTSRVKRFLTSLVRILCSTPPKMKECPITKGAISLKRKGSDPSKFPTTIFFRGDSLVLGGSNICIFH